MTDLERDVFPIGPIRPFSALSPCCLIFGKYRARKKEPPKGAAGGQLLQSRALRRTSNFGLKSLLFLIKNRLQNLCFFGSVSGLDFEAILKMILNRCLIDVELLGSSKTQPLPMVFEYFCICFMIATVIDLGPILDDVRSVVWSILEATSEENKDQKCDRCWNAFLDRFGAPLGFSAVPG